MYNPQNQYRCTIIRGKSQKEMDDLLPAYAKVIDGICPCPIEEFPQKFNMELQKYLPESQRIKKTLDNHRTEIAGKLFGMYYFAKNGIVYESQRTQKYLEDSDQPAFFKDVCYKMQFPNGMDSVQTLQDRLCHRINIRPNSYVIKLLEIAAKANEQISVKDIGYYVLNSLDVLQGNISPYEVLDSIIRDHKNGIQREIIAFDNKGRKKASSYTMQHIREQLNYLELANLIRISADKILILNTREKKTIEIFSNKYNEPPAFDVYSFDLSQIEGRKNFEFQWVQYFSVLSEHASDFDTPVEALLPVERNEPAEDKGKQLSKMNLTKFGDIGEEFVYEYEKKRVAAYNARLVNKVIPFGKIRGVGFDVQSIVAERGDKAEFCKYIEVKSTKRVTSPNLNDELWIDTLNITRNEWMAAQQHGDYYSIYRLYFTKIGVMMFMLNNIAKKKEDNIITVTPMTYRLDFSCESIDNAIKLEESIVNERNIDV